MHMGQAGINLENVKIRNRSTILKLLNSHGAMPRKDIAKQVGLTAAAVTLLCSEMMDEGILLEKGEMQEEKRAGRKKVLIDINYVYKYIVSVSIEMKRTYISLCSMKGHILADKNITTNPDILPAEFLTVVANECKALLWEQGKTHDDVLGVGICVPGIVDRAAGLSLHAYGIWKEQVDIKQRMELLMGCPVIVENNVKAFAEGELIYGLGRIGDDLLFVKWGPGVGSAIVIQNQVYEGKNHNAAEIGHYIIEPNGLPCKCGRKGCLETRVSTRAIVEKIRSVYSRDNTPKLYEYTEGHLDLITEEAFTNWVEGTNSWWIMEDESVLKILNSSIERLARAVVNVITILAPEHTILFGFMLENEVIREEFLRCCKSYDKSYTEDYITKSKLSKKNYYIGAAAIVTRELFFEAGSVESICSIN